MSGLGGGDLGGVDNSAVGSERSRTVGVRVAVVEHRGSLVVKRRRVIIRVSGVAEGVPGRLVVVTGKVGGLGGLHLGGIPWHQIATHALAREGYDQQCDLEK